MLVKNEVEWSRHFAGMYDRAATITFRPSPRLSSSLRSPCADPHSRVGGCASNRWMRFTSVDALHIGGCASNRWMRFESVDALRIGGCASNRWMRFESVDALRLSTLRIGGCASNRWMRFAYPPYASVHLHAPHTFTVMPAWISSRCHTFSSQGVPGRRSKISRWASSAPQRWA